MEQFIKKVGVLIIPDFNYTNIEKIDQVIPTMKKCMSDLG
jgi:hypothetical protein